MSFSLLQSDDSASVLRIIAEDGASLQYPYRDDLRRIADELELAQRTIATLYAANIEADQKISALQDRVNAIQGKAQNQPFPFMSMGMKCRDAQQKIVGWVSQ